MSITEVPTAERVLHDCRDAYAATLIELAEADPRVVAVVNDSVGSSKLGPFQERFPERLINVGIAEQDMVGVAAGLANGGKIPFVSAASCFLTARAMEQIKVRRRLLPGPRRPLRDVAGHGLRRARTDAPLHRGPRAGCGRSPA